MVTVWPALLHILLASAAVAAEFSGPVVSILDGDTLEVLHHQRPECIRLSGIDCPEKGQSYGKRAKHAASELAFGKDVTVHTHGRDKYTRTIGDVILPDGVNLNQELVKQGWCWSNRKYASANAQLMGLEAEARGASKGPWQDSAPVPPWEYRKAVDPSLL